MNEYKDYRITIQPAGSIGTPWQSDTIFGHMVWIVALQEGNKAVESFLEPFLDGEPPFILSDGFPGEFLPVPLFDVGDITARAHSFEEYIQYKKIKKARFISMDSFFQARKETHMRSGFVDEPYATVETLHASLSRHTHATGEEGQLFSTYESYLKEQETISVYVRCKKDWNDKIREFFERLSLTGYGRDKSTGIGAFEMQSFDEFNGFGEFEDANGFISLSSFVPAEDDPTEGRWRIRVKRGFLGEQAGNGNPFKRPLIQFEPGAVFKTKTVPKQWYGRMVTDIASGMPKAVQNCMTLAVPCRLEETML